MVIIKEGKESGGGEHSMGGGVGKRSSLHVGQEFQGVVTSTGIRGTKEDGKKGSPLTPNGPPSFV